MNFRQIIRGNLRYSCLSNFTKLTLSPNAGFNFKIMLDRKVKAVNALKNQTLIRERVHHEDTITFTVMYALLLFRGKDILGLITVRHVLV